MSELALVEKVKENISKVIVGKEEQTEQLLLALVCGGHVLIEDVPGVGKTRLVQALARSLELPLRKIPFTPDLMPADLSGYSIYDPGKKQFVYHPGLLMNPLILADGINRASPKTQSSLLEAMEERRVTVDGQEYPLPAPFLVLATQNPSDMAGTYPLPEAQVDRFLFKIRLGYPEKEQEQAMLRRGMRGEDVLDEIPAVLSLPELEEMQGEVREVTAADELIAYVAEVAAATRASRDLSLGVSPRGSLALLSAAQAAAYMAGRTYVTPDDIRSMIPFVFTHRLILKKEAIIAGKSASGVLAGVVAGVEPPALETR